MGPINKDSFICLDCETTGLDTENDRILEVACALFTFEKIETSFESLIDPERVISQESKAIHNISDEMVKNKPKAKEILPKLIKFIDKHIIVGHGINFDVTIITNEAKRAQIPCSIKENKQIDTLRLARLYGESPTNSLENLRKHFNIEYEGAHRAMSDVLVNIAVFKQLSKTFQTTEKLLLRLERPILMKVMPLGKHKGRKFSEIPLEYLLWAVNKDFDQDLLYSIRTELKQRKDKHRFEQASNPFTIL